MTTWRAGGGTVLETADSTNSWLKTRKPEPGDWVVARTQTGGRGRGDNDWISPPGNLYLSVCVPRLDPLTAVSLAVGVAAVGLCRSRGVPADVKWPNDLYSEGLKLGGILSETVGSHVVAGIGLNLVDGDLPDGALSCAAWSPGADPLEWARDLVEALPAWFAQPLPAIEEAWLSLWHGRTSRFEWGNGGVDGKLVGLDLGADRADLVSNGQQMSVTASRLVENWPR